MKKILLSLTFLNLTIIGFSQEPNILPIGFAPSEELKMDEYLQSRTNKAPNSLYRAAITTPPPLPVPYRSKGQ